MKLVFWVGRETNLASLCKTSLIKLVLYMFSYSFMCKNVAKGSSENSVPRGQNQFTASNAVASLGFKEKGGLMLSCYCTTAWIFYSLKHVILVL